MNRVVNILTVACATVLASVTLQPQPFSVGMTDGGSVAERRVQPPSPEQRSSPEMIERWLEVAEEVDPAKARRLRDMCHTDPEEFHRVMRQSARSIVGLAELKHRDPDLYELKIGELRIQAQVEATTNALAEAIRSGNEADVAAIEDELRQWVLMQVLHSIKAQGDYINRLKEHVDRLERELQSEVENWQKSTEQQCQEIISKARAAALVAAE